MEQDSSSSSSESSCDSDKENKKKKKKKEEKKVKYQPKPYEDRRCGHRWTAGQLVILFQEKADGDQSTEPKTDLASAGATIPLQGDSKPDPATYVSSVQIPGKLEKRDPPPAASDPLAGRSSLGVLQQAPLRRPTSPMESLMDRHGEPGSRTTTHLTSSDLLKPNRFYQK